MALDFDPLDPAHLADPYPGYRRLREEAPVFHYAPFDAWLLTRHADVLAVLRDPTMSVARGDPDEISHSAFPELRPELRELADAFRKVLMFLDPPDHTRIRGLVDQAFLPVVVARQRPRIQATIDELLGRAGRDGGFDWIRDLAFPLPCITIAGILGVPSEERDVFKRWSQDLGALLDPLVPQAKLDKAQASALEMHAYLGDAFRERRARPRDDLMSALVAAEREGRVLSPSELFAIAALLLGAGHLTTTNLLGNAMLALLEHPGEQQRLRARPELLPTAVEEFLRFDPPTQVTARRTRRVLRLPGGTVPEGAFVVLGLAAANRDPAVHAAPDVLDLGRQPNRHVSFGAGIHYCMGSKLARAEAELALGSLLGRFPSMKLAGDAVRKPAVVSRGLSSLPVEL